MESASPLKNYLPIVIFMALLFPTLLSGMSWGVIGQGASSMLESCEWPLFIKLRFVSIRSPIGHGQTSTWRQPTSVGQRSDLPGQHELLQLQIVCEVDIIGLTHCVVERSRLIGVH